MLSAKRQATRLPPSPGALGAPLLEFLVSAVEALTALVRYAVQKYCVYIVFLPERY
jgi:hypothetical protein